MIGDAIPSEGLRLNPKPSDIVESGKGSPIKSPPKPLEPQQSERKVLPFHNLYASVYAFNLFTITDGAIRIIVLLYANQIGLSPLDIAVLFTLYELMGVVTNLFGGVFASRFGLKASMFLSLFLQLLGLVLVVLVEPIFGDLEHLAMKLPSNLTCLASTRTVIEEGNMGKRAEVIVYITFCQALSGVAKDFMKISCKTIPKLVTKKDADEESSLFKLYSIVTGLKNSFKGFGFIFGALLTNFLGFEIAVYVLVGIVVVIVPAVVWGIDKDAGKAREFPGFNLKIFKKPWNINVLSLARFFLFGSRDVWFEVAAPLFFRNIIGWTEFEVGLFIGGYVIVYGYFQTATAKIYKAKNKDAKKTSWRPSCLRGVPPVQHIGGWAVACAAEILLLGIVLHFLYQEYIGQECAAQYGAAIAGVLIVGFYAFGVIFAVNSAIHSYFIGLFSGGDKASMDIGFYYMANAMGRLVGTILSGYVYEVTRDEFGLSICLWVSSLFMALAAVTSYFIRDPNAEEAKPSTS